MKTETDDKAAQIVALNAETSEAMQRVIRRGRSGLAPEDIQKQLKSIRSLAEVIKLSDFMTDTLTIETAKELRAPIDDRRGITSIFTNDFKQPRISERAIGGVQADDGSVDRIRANFIEGFGSPHLQGGTLPDVTKMGSFHQAVTSVFWQRMDALRHWTLGQDSQSRFDLLVSLRDEPKRRRMKLIKDSLGGEIHSLRAKDNTDRWAYYYIHVAVPKEERFLSALKNQKNIDLVDYGIVLDSVYADILYEVQMMQANKEIETWAARFESLTNCEQTSWFLSGDFAREWHLTELRRSQPNEHFSYKISPRRLNRYASSIVTDIAQQEDFDINALDQLTSSLAECSVPKLNQSLIISLNLFRAAGIVDAMTIIEMVQQSGDTLSSTLKYRLHQYSPMISKREAYGSLILWNAILRLLPVRTEVGRAIVSYFTNTEGDDIEDKILEHIKSRIEYLVFQQVDVPSDEWEKYGIALGVTIIRRLIEFSLDLSIENSSRDVSLALIDAYDTIAIANLCRIGSFIETDLSDRVNFIAKLLRSSLKGVFEETRFPEDRQGQLIADLTGKLLNRDVVSERGEWVERVLPSLKDVTARWKTDRLPEDTPATFIERHYGAFSGLHTGMIRETDPTLGRAYDRWLQKGKLDQEGKPSSFHLPAYSELDRSSDRLSDEERRHARAILSRDHRARTRQP